jgi:hypothetical protein
LKTNRKLRLKSSSAHLGDVSEIHYVLKTLCATRQARLDVLHHRTELSMKSTHLLTRQQLWVVMGVVKGIMPGWCRWPWGCDSVGVGSSTLRSTTNDEVKRNKRPLLWAGEWTYRKIEEAGKGVQVWEADKKPVCLNIKGQLWHKWQWTRG